MLIRGFARRLRQLWRLYVTKDEFTIAARKWFKDQGDQTLRLQYPDLCPDSIVFDVGGYLGNFAEEINSKYQCKIFIFEPHPEFYRSCVNKFNNQTNVVVLNYGLSNRNGIFQMTDSVDASSFENPNQSHVNRVECQVREFKGVLDELNITHIDLIKLNIEGGEYDLLEHLISNYKLENIKHYQIQFHNFVSDAISRREKIVNKLSQTHMQTWSYYFVWENWTRI